MARGLQSVMLTVSVSLGSTRVSAEDILKLQAGSVIELDQLAGKTFEVRVDGRLLGHAEMVIIDEHLGVRLTQVLPPEERLAK